MARVTVVTDETSLLRARYSKADVRLLATHRARTKPVRRLHPRSRSAKPCSTPKDAVRSETRSLDSFPNIPSHIKGTVKTRTPWPTTSNSCHIPILPIPVSPLIAIGNIRRVVVGTSGSVRSGRRR